MLASPSIFADVSIPTVSRAVNMACLGGELAGAATEVGDARLCDVAFDQRQQVEERLRTLGAKPVVLLRFQVSVMGRRRRARYPRGQVKSRSGGGSDGIFQRRKPLS